MGVCMCICMCMFVCLYVCVCVSMCVYVCMSVCVFVYVCVYVCVCVCVCLQHTARHYNALQPTHCNALKHTAILCTTLQHVVDLLFLCSRVCGVAMISRLLKMIDLFYRALLQKMPIILRGLLIVATPYEVFVYVCVYVYLCAVRESMCT